MEVQLGGSNNQTSVDCSMCLLGSQPLESKLASEVIFLLVRTNLLQDDTDTSFAFTSHFRTINIVCKRGFVTVKKRMSR